MKPSPKLALITYALYLLVFYGIWIINGIQYTHIGDTADTLMKWYVMPLAGGTVVLLILTTIFGWWKPALFENKEQRLRDRTLLIIPVIMVVAATLTLVTKDYSSTTATMWLYVIVGSLLVGFNEELVTRGLLLTGFREKYGEKKSWFLSTLCFSLIHLPNAFFGIGLAVIFQLVSTFIHGSTLYLLRRFSGLLIPAMLLHGFWDFASFVGKDGISFQSYTIIPVAILIVYTLKRTFESGDQKVE